MVGPLTKEKTRAYTVLMSKTKSDLANDVLRLETELKLSKEPACPKCELSDQVKWMARWSVVDGGNWEVTSVMGFCLRCTAMIGVEQTVRVSPNRKEFKMGKHPISNLDFRVSSGQPITVSVTKDGKEYDITVGVVVMAVEDTGKVEDGLPKFDVDAHMVLDVQEKTNE